MPKLYPKSKDRIPSFRHDSIAGGNSIESTGGDSQGTYYRKKVKMRRAPC